MKMKILWISHPNDTGLVSYNYRYNPSGVCYGDNGCVLQDTGGASFPRMNLLNQSRVPALIIEAQGSVL